MTHSSPPSAEQWQTAFRQTLRQSELADPLREAALQERLGEWTKALTVAVIVACQNLGWQASGKGHPLKLLPVVRGEYLALDVTAFAGGEKDKRWRFPSAIFELENSQQDDYIAYALWKILCVRAELRVVFCYRRQPEEGKHLVRYLEKDVIHSLSLENRTRLEGTTVIVVGSRAESITFPDGFFKWWRLENNIGEFKLI